MFLQDFIIERNIKQSAASMYIKRHDKDFAGHTELRDGKMWLDETAVELLSKKYPVPVPDNVWTPAAKQKYDELQEELRETNKEIRQLNAENRELREYELKYRALETQQMLLIQTAVNESEEKLKEKFDEDRAKLKAHYDEEIEKLRVKLEEKDNELQVEKNKGFFQKLFGR